jgi:hypothetical protein
LRAMPLILGLVTGLCVAVSGWSLGWMPFGLHPGTLGLLFNVSVIMIAQYCCSLKMPRAKISN